MRKKFNLLIGDTTVERLKKKWYGSSHINKYVFNERKRYKIRYSKRVALTEEDALLMPILNQMLSGIKEALENTPPELSQT